MQTFQRRHQEPASGLLNALKVVRKNLQRGGKGVLPWAMARTRAVLSPFGLLWQDTTDWVAYSHQKFTPDSPGGWKSEAGVPTWWCSGEPLLSGSQLAPSHCILTWGGGRRELSGASFFKDTNPTYEAPTLMT